MEKNNLPQFQRLFTITKNLSKAYFVSANISKKKNLTIQLNFWDGNFLFVKW